MSHLPVCFLTPTKALFLVLLVMYRFHGANHRGRECRIYCSSEDKTDRLLWGSNSSGEPVFLFNSAIAESVNSLFYRLGPCLKKMSAVMNNFHFAVQVLTHNEILTREKTIALGARFRA